MLAQRANVRGACWGCWEGEREGGREVPGQREREGELTETEGVHDQEGRREAGHEEGGKEGTHERSFLVPLMGKEWA